MYSVPHDKGKVAEQAPPCQGAPGEGPSCISNVTQRLDCIKLARVEPTKCPSKHKVLDMPLAGSTCLRPASVPVHVIPFYWSNPHHVGAINYQWIIGDSQVSLCFRQISSFILSMRKCVISFLIIPSALATQGSCLIALVMARCNLWPKRVYEANLECHKLIAIVSGNTNLLLLSQPPTIHYWLQWLGKILTIMICRHLL